MSLAAPLAVLSLAAVPHLSSPQDAGSPPTPASAPVAENTRWDLRDLYPSDQVWQEAKAGYGKKLLAFARHKDRLADGTKALGNALASLGKLQNEIQRLLVYAQARSNEDTRQPGPRSMQAEAETLAVQLETATAWVKPELLAMPAAKLAAARAGDERLRDWSFFIENVLRGKPHTLTAGEERLVSMAGDLAGAPGDIYRILKDADLPFPTVKLSSGEQVRLDPAGYARTRTSSRHDERVKVFQSFFGALKGFERTMGASLHAQMKVHVFNRDAHKFTSSLEAALFRDNIPVSIYRQLVKDVNANLPTLHRYLKLRQRLLGQKQLGYEDLYAPLVPEVERHYTIDEAKRMVLAAVAPLGPEYQRKLEHGFGAGWTDFLPRTGKRAGAYSTGVYGVHPYQLLNYNGQWEDVSTLAHESGHSMHTLLAFAAQPYPTSDYATFVAEVASTLNEDLLFRHALAHAASDRERLALLGQRLEGLRTTLFRQTMFAEFELTIHERAEQGEALTGEKLTALYLDLVRKYYGHDQGVCTVADLYGAEWIFVPHFYYDFYVYQYATSVIASAAMAKAIMEERKADAVERYLTLLGAGGSAYPADLLRRAGVDLTTPAPFQAAIEEMNAIIDQIEKLRR
jgi:oligoendopeptidase F